ncbi:microfibril-associated glycoprotein 4-like [Ylistrum balloti]|uniref:microfibril-associated glycoprotein 4-like n=1 Tax=Ylistrum balloti TaxID=509963 RepID=UPI002905EEFE|nr:microfibril-associated glycoprotein 4-like [Ylistrum balloti]
MLNDKYRIVLRTKEQNHVGSVIQRLIRRSKIGCAITCNLPQCLSFSYNSVTRECKTYGDEICYHDDGAMSSSLTFYVRNVKSLLGVVSHCGKIPLRYCSAVFTVYPSQAMAFGIYCDMDTAGGPWTIVANRYDGSQDFYQPWDKYKQGFGNLTGEYWIGFQKYTFLQTLNLKMRIEMGGWDGSLKHVEYTSMTVAPESLYYALFYTGFSSPHGLVDNLAFHKNQNFSTYDKDHDRFPNTNCPSSARGAWWYNACYDSNLFGLYSESNGFKSMVWKYFYDDGEKYSAIKSLRMMLATP